MVKTVKVNIIDRNVICSKKKLSDQRHSIFNNNLLQKIRLVLFFRKKTL